MLLFCDFSDSVILLISLNYLLNVMQTAAVNTGGVVIYFYVCVSLLPPVCTLCMCVCDIK